MSTRSIDVVLKVHLSVRLSGDTDTDRPPGQIETRLNAQNAAAAAVLRDLNSSTEIESGCGYLAQVIAVRAWPMLHPSLVHIERDGFVSTRENSKEHVGKRFTVKRELSVWDLYEKTRSRAHKRGSTEGDRAYRVARDHSPMFLIQLETGEDILAYPEEIYISEQEAIGDMTIDEDLVRKYLDDFYD